MNKWISVKDRKPDDDVFYLVSTKDPFQEGHRRLGLLNFTDGSGYYVGEVTHWMERPEDPEDD